MKKYKIWLLVALLPMLVVSCNKHDKEAAPISLTVNVAYNDADKVYNLPLDTVKITLHNNTNGQSYTAKTNAQGVAIFPSIVPGNYSASASLTIPSANYNALTGILVSDDVQFNAAVTGTSLVTPTASFNLTLESGRIGDLVIKQFYYAGSNTSTGASFRDEFVEIYNNSNDTIYLDSLYIGDTWANNNKLSDGALPFDWSKSIGIPTGIGDASKDYVYLRYLFIIPGSGTDHPLAPGKSIVIAQTAINHAATYTDNSGKVQGITNPDLTVDLSNADWETYLVDYKRATAANPATFTPYRWDLDNPLVPNIGVILSASGNDWVFDSPGRDDLVIFKVPAGKTFNASLAYYDPTFTTATVTATTNKYIQVPVSYVIDALEVEPPVPTNRIPKRLPTSLDAAATFVTAGQYSSQSLVRKTAKTLSNGRRVLQDTNNSDADFFTKTKADPSKTDASFAN